MRKPIQTYALTVCFFTMACLAITSGLAIWNGFKILAPKITMSKKDFRIYQSDSAFLGYLSNKYEYKIKRNEFTLPSKEQISSIRQQAYSEFIATEKHAATSSLLFQLIIIFVDIIVFWFHWRLAKKNEQHG